MDYAEDLTLLSSTQADAKEKKNPDRLNQFAEQIGLQNNTKKTKLIDFTNLNTDIKLNNQMFEKSS